MSPLFHAITCLFFCSQWSRSSRSYSTDSPIFTRLPTADEARQSGVAIEVEAPDQFVWVDRTRIEQALSNLIGNAIVHGKGGSTVEVRCHVNGSRPAEVLAVDVLDRGPGIGAESAEELFEPFRRGAAPLGSGSGLGLATVAATIKAHRGRFGAENRAGGGARFWFVVPVDRPRSVGLQTRDDEPP